LQRVAAHVTDPDVATPVGRAPVRSDLDQMVAGMVGGRGAPASPSENMIPVFLAQSGGQIAARQAAATAPNPSQASRVMKTPPAVALFELTGEAIET
jgi:hypothetical protein